MHMVELERRPGLKQNPGLRPLGASGIRQACTTFHAPPSVGPVLPPEGVSHKRPPRCQPVWWKRHGGAHRCPAPTRDKGCTPLSPRSAIADSAIVIQRGQGRRSGPQCPQDHPDQEPTQPSSLFARSAAITDPNEPFMPNMTRKLKAFAGQRLSSSPNVYRLQTFAK